MVEEKHLVQNNLQQSAEDISQQLAEESSFNSKLEKPKEVNNMLKIFYIITLCLMLIFQTPAARFEFMKQWYFMETVFLCFTTLSIIGFMYYVVATKINTPDSLTLAKWDREHQGPWEAEYSYGYELDLHRHKSRCQKNPGHENFIPVDKFTIEDLPEGYQDQKLVEYIQVISYLTVRVAVTYVSEDRPPTEYGSHKPYPLYNVRGQDRTSVGTGHVLSVEINKDNKGVHCKCNECRNSAPKKEFGTITIQTATHIVFDEVEGENTTCSLFFDRGDEPPEKCTGVVTLKGMFYVDSEDKDDVCQMKHYTHDLELAEELQKKVEKREKICETLMAKMRNSFSLCKTQVDPNTQPLLFIVSHPHGCSKQISLGRWRASELCCGYLVFFEYDAATCNGSSGAPVCLLMAQSETMPVLRATIAVHRGTSEKDPGFNLGYIEGGIEVQDLTKENMLLNLGTGEITFCSMEEEADQIKDYAACKWNPGHKNCIPLEKFRKDNLPRYYRTDHVMKFVKLMSDLTVRVSVNYVSDERPDTVPGTVIRYPWSNNKCSGEMRVGTGFVIEAGIVDESCLCQECKNSPERQLAYIHIFTSAHLVYNKQETEHTTCHLFYDSGETPDDCKSVVALTDLLFIDNHIGGDTCLLECRTHNLELVRKLAYTTNKIEHEKYSLCRKALSVKQNGGQNAKQEPPLKIMVYHPHGCSKHVSIECCGNPGDADTEESLPSQTTIYCPGVSGASAFVLGRQRLFPISV